MEQAGDDYQQQQCPSSCRLSINDVLFKHSSTCVSSAKRPVGMSSILNRIGGKKQKMSTLEKSKMDWDAFKSEEGISEELAIHNRGKEG